MRFFQAAVIKLYRRLLPVRPDGHLTDQDILTQVGLPSPIELLGRARLRYVATILHCGVQTEWGLLNGGRPTMDWACGGNMEWVWKQLQHSSHLLEPRQNWEQWHNLTVFHRSYWRRLVRRACEHAIMQRSNVCHLMEFHQAALHSLRELYDTITPRTSILRKLNRGCLLSRKRYRTKAGEAAHMFRRAHGIIARRRTLTDTPTCPACLKNYHTMDKVSAHLYYSSRCRRTLQSRNYACIAVPGAGSLED